MGQVPQMVRVVAVREGEEITYDRPDGSGNLA
ncbi:hypothetical protein SAMN05216174_113107 [Actinokineospora iranica]|uniref:Uncharacterized protein n=1 Tax=Actinokineospora iranica TaxID=1271860 RepID=A0A1G6VV68_9PSEU|nr:hypothetical protein SAMN05216174_113107 [Actinokineospora iranica]